MKTSLISIVILAAVVTAAVESGGHYNTSDLPEIVVTPPSNDNRPSDNTVGPNNDNLLGQNRILYGDA
ncbi:hypothetical protein BDV27DRAFT_158150 [Aspergillus caelatus]|uniref:Uncharacterized protein n=2 Tax=Aspergillus subgen. Circumdati TaxID=2720871 RepID=A0A5N7A3S2_9EURO|nr:uncharacterized protein BDV27DRAFT_158150 [Aspergillus caelatus]KAE8364088.1 hypothetical protein BDV27DRAFT_158150 [Aspergillus caelatus]KAE8416418.1 hypothetical protein BDV36DRAFT_297114 [Aspergillus pseudocaelatus]